MITDPILCRRALREISEVAAVAVLENSQMTEAEALETIAAIAAWMRAEPGVHSRACRDAIGDIHRLTAGVDFDELEDREVHARFQAVLGTIQGRDPPELAPPA